jgi:phospholipid/cholesterol/gamma-HCH transport system substrate-binding protein
MKIPHAALPKIRSTVVITFVALCALFFGYLWTNMGGTIPGVSGKGYRVTLELSDADNLVYDSDVMVAGVRVGKVRELESENGKARVVVQLDDEGVVPLHEGATVRIRSKSLIEETYLEVQDGS